MLLPNTEENIVNNTANLRDRINELKQIKALNQPIGLTDQLRLQILNGLAVSFEEKLAAIREYQVAKDHICLLRAVEIGVFHISQKNLFALNTGERAYSRAATVGGCVAAPFAGFFRNRGIEKQRERLVLIDTVVSELERDYLGARILHRLGLG
jgi:hypothetical protein